MISSENEEEELALAQAPCVHWGVPMKPRWPPHNHTRMKRKKNYSLRSCWGRTQLSVRVQSAINLF
jgi:hypothetical protein